MTIFDKFEVILRVDRTWNSSYSFEPSQVWNIFGPFTTWARWQKLDKLNFFVCVEEWGWGIEGKQVGSMDEESQVRGCYYFYLYTNQPGNSVCIEKDTSKQNI